MNEYFKNKENIWKLYEDKYDIHICRYDEIEYVMDFIDTYWKKNHILTKSRELLNWQHLDVSNDRFSFIIAKDRITKEIHGILGYIMSNMYDDSIAKPIRWGVIWKVREDVAMKGLGLALKYYMEKLAPAPYVGGVGLSKYSKAINKKLNEHMGILNQYYILNGEKENFVLVDNSKNYRFDKYDSTISIQFLEIKDGFIDAARQYLAHCPEYKSYMYYKERYYNHPIYQYRFTEIVRDSEPVACLIWRICNANDEKAIFIVDYIGDGLELKGHYNDFQYMLFKEDAEYLMFCNAGVNETYFKEAGFRIRQEDEIVLPIYYEPFEKKNVELDYHFYSDAGKYSEEIIYKGDADQDRPNYYVKQGD